MNFGNVIRIAALGAVVGGVGYALYKSIKSAKAEDDRTLARIKVTSIILDIQMINLFVQLNGSGLLNDAQVNFIADITVKSQNGSLDNLSLDELESIKDRLAVIKLIVMPGKKG
jgi:hypothetical protein